MRRVLRGARGQDRSVVPSSTVVGGSKAKEINQIDEPESLIMDWVQVSARVLTTWLDRVLWLQKKRIWNYFDHIIRRK